MSKFETSSPNEQPISLRLEALKSCALNNLEREFSQLTEEEKQKPSARQQAILTAAHRNIIECGITNDVANEMIEQIGDSDSLKE